MNKAISGIVGGTFIFLIIVLSIMDCGNTAHENTDDNKEINTLSITVDKDCESDVTIDANPSGGFGNYSVFYSCTNGQNGAAPLIFNVGSGPATITCFGSVTDGAGCEHEDEVVINVLDNCVDCDCDGPTFTVGCGFSIMNWSKGFDAGCDEYETCLILRNGQTVPPSNNCFGSWGSNLGDIWTYTMTDDDGICDPITITKTFNCGNCECNDPDPTLSIVNCVANWNDTYCDWDVSLESFINGAWVTVATSPTFTVNINQDYRLRWEKTGCAVGLSTIQSVSNCGPPDCTDCPNTDLVAFGCNLSWINCASWVATLWLNGSQITPSGVNSHLAIVDGVYEVRWNKAGCPQQTDSETVTGCSPPDCTGCTPAPPVATACDVTHDICTNGWIATFYLAGTNTVVDGDNDGTFTGVDGGSYDLRYEKANCKTIIFTFTTSCPIVTCNDCIPNTNPTITDDCEILYTECAGWTLTIDGIAQAGGTFQGVPNTQYLFVYSKPGCLNIQFNVTTPAAQINITFGVPNVFITCEFNSPTFNVNFPDYQVECICCDDDYLGRFDFEVTYADNTTDIITITSFACQGGAQWERSDGGVCSDPSEILGTITVEVLGFNSHITNPGNCTVNVTDVGVSGSVTYTQSEYEDCCECPVTQTQDIDINIGAPTLEPFICQGVFFQGNTLLPDGTIDGCDCCTFSAQIFGDVEINGTIVQNNQSLGFITCAGFNMNDNFAVCGPNTPVPYNLRVRPTSSNLLFNGNSCNYNVTGLNQWSNTATITQAQYDQCCN